MNMRFMAVSLLITSLGICSPIFAAPADFNNLTSDIHTTDIASGLQWLDLGQTHSKSYDYVKSHLDPGGIYEDYRYASVDEFATMITNFFDVAVDLVGQDPNQHNVYADDFHTFFGVTHDLTLAGVRNVWSMGHLQDGTYSSIVGAVIKYTFPQPQSGRIITLADVLLSTQPNDVGHGAVGHFLVRTNNLIATPIPSALFMFAPALLGFLGLRRKLKA